MLPDHSFFHFFATFLAGGTSAALAVTAVAPFERIKLLLQVQKGACHISPDKEYKGIIDCFVRIPKEQGFLSLWRGNWAAVIRSFPYQALNFSLKELFREQFVNSQGPVKHRLFGNLVAGGLAGACALSVIYPLDYARTRMALDVGRGKSRMFRGVFHCISQTFKEYGLKAVYRGYFFSVFGVFIYRSLYFGLYDTIMGCIKPKYAHEIWIEFPVAEFSATFAGFVSYPLDTVRRQMMLQSFKPLHRTHSKHIQYHTPYEYWMKIYNREGIRGFYHGGLTNVYRGTGGAICLVLYDNIQHWLLEDHPILSKYIPLRHGPSDDGDSKPDKAEEHVEFLQTVKHPCKIFKDRCVFCNF